MTFHRSSEDDTRRLAGRYQLLERAGGGGMSTVWRAVMHWEEGFFRQVAVKQIRSRLAFNRKFIAMFVEEARIGSQLQHPNIVQILDFGREDDLYFLVMEWVDGLDLGTWTAVHSTRGEVTPWPLVAAIGVEALRALGAAHELIDHWGHRAPVIHRDVTPHNILIGSSGVVKLTDFGLSRAKDRARTTDPNIIKGKLGYLSPEVAWGKEATPQSDLFCLGIVLWEALAGRRLYEGDDDVQVVLAARAVEIPDLRELRDDVPEDLVELLECALAEDPEFRFDSARQMLRAMTRVLHNQRQPTDALELSRSVREARVTLDLPPRSSLPEDLLRKASRARTPPLPDTDPS
jgi:serine/threonine-protein kinase